MGQSVLLAREGDVVCDRCEIADGVITRVRGLLGRSGLPRGHGLLIEPTWSVHTWFMRFPIDVVFLGTNGDVLKVAPHVKPWRMRSCRRARAVLELAAGEAKMRGIKVGDRIDRVDA
jgi:uncharacterized protein